jgi:hypothetical protein
MKDKKNNQILKNFLIGGLSGMTATLIVSKKNPKSKFFSQIQPIDMLKVRI